MDASKVYRSIFEQIYTETYVPARALCERLHLSEKTVRKYVRSLDEYLSLHGAGIEVSQGKGYRVVVTDPAAFSEIYGAGILKTNDSYSTEERLLHLLLCLLESHAYVPIEMLTRVCCTSEATLEKDLRILKSRLKDYRIVIEVKLNQGVRISGPEYELRKCLLICLVQKDVYGKSDPAFLNLITEIHSVVGERLSAHGIFIPEISRQNISFALYVAVRRIRTGFPVNFPEAVYRNMEEKYGELLERARDLCTELSRRLSVSFEESEIVYAALYMAGYRAVKYEELEKGNLVISGRIRQIVEEMLEAVYLTMGYDFRGSLALQLDLWKHMVSLDIRLRYGLYLDNPLLGEIQKQYGTAFLAARQASVVLKKEYQMEIPESETGYLAVFFGLYLEKSKDYPEEWKKNILFICASGRLSSELLALQYKRAFPHDIHRIEVCDLGELGTMDLSGFDCIITTIPIYDPVPLPIIRVKNMLDLAKVRDSQEELKQYLAKTPFYEERLFFQAKKLKDKEAVLAYMVEQISAVRDLEEGFLESVLRREELDSTDYFEGVAMPHSMERRCREDFAAVCVLERPVFWGKKEVQVVILVHIYTENRKERDQFYDRTTDFVLDHTKVARLLEEPGFSRFLSLMKHKS